MKLWMTLPALLLVGCTTAQEKDAAICSQYTATRDQFNVCMLRRSETRSQQISSGLMQMSGALMTPPPAPVIQPIRQPLYCHSQRTFYGVQTVCR